MKRTMLMRRTPLRRISARRLEQMAVYRVRCGKFLRDHPYCQHWLAMHGVAEDEAIRNGGWVRLQSRSERVRAPRSSMVHHRNKRRGHRLLDEREWLGVSYAGHRAIEENPGEARRLGFLKPF